MKSKDRIVIARTAAACLAAAILSAGTRGAIYVAPQARSFAPDGTLANPHSVIETAACQLQEVQDAPVLALEPGEYYQILQFDAPMTVIAPGGLARVGLVGAHQRTIKVVSYNTHLFGGLNVYPVFAGTYWKDTQRAEAVGYALQDENADVVGLQEVWDSQMYHLIRDHAGYAFTDYGDEVDYFPDSGTGPFNSGLMLLSKHSWDTVEQVFYNEECGFFEERASKGYLATTVTTNDGFQFGFFNTHTQSGECGGSGGAATRASQLQQLADAIALYRMDHPSHPVIAVGDFNLPAAAPGGMQGEYNSSMAGSIGGLAGMRDAVRNTCAGQLITVEDDNPLNIYFSACDQPAYAYCLTACAPVGRTCEYLCGAGSLFCELNCEITESACKSGCDVVGDTCGALCNVAGEACYHICVGGCALTCTGPCCGGFCTENDNCEECIDDCRNDCRLCDSDCDACVSGCESRCEDVGDDCRRGCPSSSTCNACHACERACEDALCNGTPSDRRLDYVLYAPSGDGMAEIVPLTVERQRYTADSAFSDPHLTTDVLSDHEGLISELRIIRR